MALNFTQLYNMIFNSLITEVLCLHECKLKSALKTNLANSHSIQMKCSYPYVTHIAFVFCYMNN